MRPLDGPDLFHLAQERPDRPMHTLKVAVLDRSLDPAHLRQWATAVLTSLAPLRQRLDGLPLARPVWVDGGPPDLDYHLAQAAVGRPGGEAELAAAISRLCGPVLDRSRPLWRLWHLTGLEGGRDALAFQIHHAVADGLASVALWTAIADETETPRDQPAGPLSSLELVAETLRRSTREVTRLPSQASRFAAYLRRARAIESSGRPAVTKAFLGPPTRFNVNPELDRHCVFATLPMARLRAIRTASGATINELFLALSGRAVHRYLDALGEPPTGALTAAVPAALPDRPSPYGNNVTTLYLSLHSDLADPIERIEAVRASFAATRTSTDEDPRLLPDWQCYAWLNHGLIKVMEAAERRNGRPAYNLIVSSVRGPERFHLAGAEVAQLRSVGPLSGNFGLNMTGWSYGEEFVVGIQAYASAAQGLEGLGALLIEELDAIELGLDATTGGSPQ